MFSFSRVTLGPHGEPSGPTRRLAWNQQGQHPPLPRWRLHKTRPRGARAGVPGSLVELDRAGRFLQVRSLYDRTKIVLHTWCFVCTLVPGMYVYIHIFFFSSVITCLFPTRLVGASFFFKVETVTQLDSWEVFTLSGVLTKP